MIPQEWTKGLSRLLEVMKKQIWTFGNAVLYVCLIFSFHSKQVYNRVTRRVSLVYNPESVYFCLLASSLYLLSNMMEEAKNNKTKLQILILTRLTHFWTDTIKGKMADILACRRYLTKENL